MDATSGREETAALSFAALKREGVFDDRHLQALRAARALLSQPDRRRELQISPSDLLQLSELCSRAYARAQRPVRSDFVLTVFDHVALYLRGGSAVDIAGRDQLIADVDLHCIALFGCEGFCGPSLGAVAVEYMSRIASRALEQGLKRIQVTPAALMAMTSVAVSLLHSKGKGVVPDGCGPVGRNSRFVERAGSISLSATLAPEFRASIALRSQGLAVTLDRDVLRTVMALLIAAHPSVVSTYEIASISPPSPRRRGLLTIGGNVEIALDPARYVLLQNAFRALWNDDDFRAWMHYRALLFGDL